MHDATLTYSRLTGGDYRTFGDQECTASAARPTECSLEALFSEQVAERFAPPRALFWEGDAAKHVFHLIEGCLRVHRTMEDGRRAILGFSYAGDLVGVSARDTYHFTAEAVTPARFRRLSRRRFDELVEGSPVLRGHLHAENCREIRAAQDQIIRLGRTSARERVAAFLVHVAQRAGGCITPAPEIEVPFARLDIADHLGLTVETISREISHLKNEGLISMNGPHWIVLRRMRSLREIAGLNAGP
jgi:CRP/FNR family transcriptional regulator